MQGGVDGLAGVITVEVIEARLPRRLSVTKKEKPLNPYAAIVVGHSHVAIRCMPLTARRATGVQLRVSKICFQRLNFAFSAHRLLILPCIRYAMCLTWPSQTAGSRL